MDDRQSDNGFPYSSGSSAAGLDFDYLMSPGGGGLHFDPGGLSNLHASAPALQSFSEDWESIGSNFMGKRAVSPRPSLRLSHARTLSLNGSSSTSPAPSLQLQVVSPAPVQRIQQLEQAYDTLRQENLMLGTENRTIKKMYFMLLNRIPALLSQPGDPLDTKGRSSAPGLSRNDAPPLLASAYPNIKWWKLSDWTEHNGLQKGTSDGSALGPRGATRISQGINVKMRYVQYADGTVVDGYRITAIKSYTAGVLNEVGNKGLASPTWMRSGRDIREHVYFEICAKYPEMGLCQDDWKCQRMLIDMYPSWYTGFTSSKAKRPRSTLPNNSDSSKRVKIKVAEAEIDFEDMYTMEASFRVFIYRAPQGPADADDEMAPMSSSLPLPYQGEHSDIEPPKIPFKIINPLHLELETDLQGSESSGSGSVLPITPARATVISASAGVMAAATAVVSVPITPLPSNADPDTLFAHLGQGVTGSVTPLGDQTVSTVFQPLAPVIVDPLGYTAQPVVPAPSITAPAAPLVTNPVKKDSKMAPSKTSKTPRNLCAIDWCGKHPNGSTSQFKLHWDSLDTVEAKSWKKLAKDAAAAQAQAAS